MGIDRYHINTGLDGFCLLDKITKSRPDRINGQAVLENSNACLVIEALAQLGAMHTRFLCDFTRHAFLLKIDEFKLDGFKTELNQGLPTKQQDPISISRQGVMVMEAQLLINTQSATSYDLKAVFDSGQRFLGRFSFATRAYGHQFDEKKLKTHYTRMFKCLTGI